MPSLCHKIVYPLLFQESFLLSKLFEKVMFQVLSGVLLDLFSLSIFENDVFALRLLIFRFCVAGYVTVKLAVNANVALMRISGKEKQNLSHAI
jgi:hypothetical protein